MAIVFPFTPFAHQRAAHAAKREHRFMVLVWHRRAGKTVWAEMELVLAGAAAKREASRFAYVAPFLNQAVSVAWPYLLRFTRDIPGISVNESKHEVTLPNGASIRIFGADNADALRGLYFDGIVLDEIADMRPNVWGEIIRPALADRQGWAIFIGTPKGVNLFSELYYRALKEPGWKADRKTWRDTGVIPQAEIDAARREMTEAQFAQEFDCDFAAAADDILISLQHVLEAQHRDLLDSQYDFAPKVLGVDVARYGSDETVIFPRQGLASFKPRRLRGLSTMDVAGHVAEFNDRWGSDGIFVDAGGMGAGVIDRLQQLGYQVVPIDFGGKPRDERFQNKRAEMWWEMNEWLKSGGGLPRVDGLEQQLTAPKMTYRNARGKMQLESKDDMRERGLPSPDMGDALCCTFAAPVAKKAHRMAAAQAAQVALDYDPYA